MSPSLKRAAAILAAGLLLSACGFGPGRPAQPPLALGVKQVPLLSGRVRPPAPKAALRLLSGPGGLLTDAIVSLIDAAGNTRVAGLVEADGHFTLVRSTDGFEPQAGVLYTIEAINRSATSEGEGNWVALRTVGRRLADGSWESLSGSGPVEIDERTTVLARVMDGDPGVTFEAAKGRAPLIETAGLPGTAYDSAYFALQLTRLETAYTSGDDPSGELVYSGNVTIAKQSDFAQWQDYDAFTGSLTIDGSGAPPGDEITAIALPRLKRLGIQCYVINCPALTDLSGLGNLRSVFHFGLQNNAALTSLAGLEKLRTLSWVSLYGGHPLLTDVSVLDGLVLSQLELYGTEALSEPPRVETLALSLADLPLVTELSRLKVSPSGGISLRNLSGLATLAGFQLPATLSSLAIDNCGALTSLAGLEALRTVRGLDGNLGALSISNNGGLTSLHGLENLTSLDGSLSISGNPLLASVAALGGLTGLGATLVSVNNNPLLCFDPAALWPGAAPASLGASGNGPCP